MILIYLVYHFFRLMYSMYYFNSGNFSRVHLCDAQTYVSNVYTGTHSGFCFKFFKFSGDELQQCFAGLMGKTDVENFIDCIDFCCGAEDELICNVKFTEQVFSCCKKHSDCAYAYQAAPD